MKFYILIITLIFLTVLKGYSQSKPKTNEDLDETGQVSTTDPVEIRKAFFSSFYQKGEKLSASLLRDVVVNSPEAVKQMNIARKKYYTAIALNTVGSCLVGYQVASALFGSRPDWKWLGAGVGLLGGGIAFTRSYYSRAENAAELHNANLKKSFNYDKSAELKLGLNSTGLGLSLTF